MRLLYIIIGLFVFSCVFSTTGKAQFNPPENLPAFSVGIGYYGELITHPGFKLFAEHSLNQSKNRLLVRANIINYRHRHHTKNWIFTPEFVYRRYTKKINFWEAAIGSGLHSQKADAKVFEYTSNGFSETTKGMNYYSPSIALSYGKTITTINNQTFIASLGGRMFWQYPFNDAWLTRYAIDFSINYKIK